MTEPSIAIPGVDDLAEIGRGGMAVVYRGRQAAFSRDVAVKVVVVAGVDERTRQRFEQECRAVGALSEHPNIVNVHGAGETADGLPYLIMGFQPGGSLADRLARDGTLRWAEVADIGVKMAGALESAHRAGVLHRDVKPENILVSSFGEPVLADFGIARVTGGAALTASGMVTGTPAHAAPEMLRGEPPTAASDVYGLASTLHHLLTGSPAFVRPTDESTLAVMNRVLVEPPPDLTEAGVPAALAQVVDRGMAKDPAERYPTARELGLALRQAQLALGLSPTPLPVALEEGAEPDPGETVVVAGPVSALTPTPPSVPTGPVGPPPAPIPESPHRPPRWPWALAALVLVGGAVGVSLLLGDGSDDRAGPAPASTVAPTTTTPTTTTSGAIDPTTAIPLTLTGATASSTAPDGIDASGDPVSYAATNVIDGDPGTAWRTEGDGVGTTLRIQLAVPAYVTAVGLVPGYDKVDPTDGSDRFVENRRVEQVRWSFDDGSSVVQPFADARDLQSLPITATRTSTVTIEILATTPAGGRDFTPISEVEIDGVAA